LLKNGRKFKTSVWEVLLFENLVVAVDPFHNLLKMERGSEDV
jgi:hypothetical protein